ANASTGISDQTLSSCSTRKELASITSPTAQASTSCLVKISMISCSRPFSTTSNILSCVSDNIISYADILSSACGTKSKFNNIPVPAADAISLPDDVKPAAPISCIPTSASWLITSKQASINFFSKCGFPAAGDASSFSSSSDE